MLIRIFEEGECENRAQGKRGLSVDEAPKKVDRGDVMQRAGGQIGLKEEGPLPLQRQGRVKGKRRCCWVCSVDGENVESSFRHLWKVGGRVPRCEGGRRR